MKILDIGREKKLIQVNWFINILIGLAVLDLLVDMFEYNYHEEAYSYFKVYEITRLGCVFLCAELLLHSFPKWADKLFPTTPLREYNSGRERTLRGTFLRILDPTVWRIRMVLLLLMGTFVISSVEVFGVMVERTTDTKFRYSFLNDEGVIFGFTLALLLSTGKCIFLHELPCREFGKNALYLTIEVFLTLASAAKHGIAWSRYHNSGEGTPEMFEMNVVLIDGISLALIILFNGMIIPISCKVFFPDHKRDEQSRRRIFHDGGSKELNLREHLRSFASEEELTTILPSTSREDKQNMRYDGQESDDQEIHECANSPKTDSEVHARIFLDGNENGNGTNQHDEVNRGYWSNCWRNIRFPICHWNCCPLPSRMWRRRLCPIVFLLNIIMLGFMECVKLYFAVKEHCNSENDVLETICWCGVDLVCLKLLVLPFVKWERILFFCPKEEKTRSTETKKKVHTYVKKSSMEEEEEGEYIDQGVELEEILPPVEDSSGEEGEEEEILDDLEEGVVEKGKRRIMEDLKISIEKVERTPLMPLTPESDETLTLGGKHIGGVGDEERIEQESEVRSSIRQRTPLPPLGENRSEE